ncbi:MAG TPA: ABC transporter permease, partial [Gemmataceae bacterium]|nr:ABC transporter permease [Gemmataceae bacterium]
MRWSIVRVIWVRELRDQLRDRRTIFMIAVLPLLLYPLIGLGIGELVVGIGQKPQVVGVYGVENLPAAAEGDPAPLFVRDADGSLRLAAEYVRDPDQQTEAAGAPRKLQPAPEIRELGTAGSAELTIEEIKTRYGKPLDDRTVDVVVVVPSGFAANVGEEKQAKLWVLERENDEHSHAVNDRFTAALSRWRKTLRETRLSRHGLRADFADPFRIEDPSRDPHNSQRANTELFALLLRVFPFILVMWSLAGALYPAVDLCAGEKERGTMETLLISPASREEIVWGKFLTIWVFSAATALLNLLSMGLTALNLSGLLPNAAFSPGVLIWSVLLVLPLSAFFSAVSLAVGAYARSSKEGQYYLMPLFLLTLLLVLPTLLGGLELNPLSSMVPVTGVA